MTIEQQHPIGTSAITLQGAIHRLAAGDGSDDDFLTVRHTLDGLKELVREIDGLANHAMIEFLKEREGRQVTDGERRHYLTTAKTTRCRNSRAAIEALLTATGGDLDRLCQMMASQPFKHGACKSVLEERWDEHFEVVERDMVKVGVADGKFTKRQTQ